MSLHLSTVIRCKYCLAPTGKQHQVHRGWKGVGGILKGIPCAGWHSSCDEARQAPRSRAPWRTGGADRSPCIQGPTSHPGKNIFGLMSLPSKLTGLAELRRCKTLPFCVYVLRETTVQACICSARQLLRGVGLLRLRMRNVFSSLSSMKMPGSRAGDKWRSYSGPAEAVPPACAQQQSAQDADKFWLTHNHHLQCVPMLLLSPLPVELHMLSFRASHPHSLGICSILYCDVHQQRWAT